MLIIEDGTGVVNANSYVTREEFIAFAAERGVEVPDEDKTDTFGILAMDFLSIQCYIGDIAYPGEQYLNWPRSGLLLGDTEPNYVYIIPAVMKRAQLHLWLAAFNGIILVPARQAEAQLKRKKVGPIEKEYFAATDYFPDLPMVAALLLPVQCGQGIKVRTYRA